VAKTHKLNPSSKSPCLSDDNRAVFINFNAEKAPLPFDLQDHYKKFEAFLSRDLFYYDLLSAGCAKLVFNNPSILTTLTQTSLLLPSLSPKGPARQCHEGRP